VSVVELRVPSPAAGAALTGPIAVLKIGGSVLTGPAGYARAAAHVAERLAANDGTRLVVVVSAEHGHTDALAAEALHAAGGAAPDGPLLDLLWSTGETRSTALVALHLRALGVVATGLSVHETGIEHRPGRADATVDPAALHAALDTHAVVVVPGFLAVRGRRIVSLGRGGSDWSAVLVAVALGAACCELVKDVDGYFTADPASSPGAAPIPRLSYAAALRMADDGCPLVQRPAIATAARARLPLVIRSVTGTGTRVQE
jgi:aspartate kinase